jgi:acetamidase/formamidase
MAALAGADGLCENADGGAGPVPGRTNPAPPQTMPPLQRGYFSTSAAVQEIDEGVVAAVHDMVELLQERLGLSKMEAYILCSAAADLKISVPKLGPTHRAFVTFNMPRTIFVG